MDDDRVGKAVSDGLTAGNESTEGDAIKAVGGKIMVVDGGLKASCDELEAVADKLEIGDVG